MTSDLDPISNLLARWVNQGLHPDAAEAVRLSVEDSAADLKVCEIMAQAIDAHARVTGAKITLHF